MLLFNTVQHNAYLRSSVTSRKPACLLAAHSNSHRYFLVLELVLDLAGLDPLSKRTSCLQGCPAAELHVRSQNILPRA